MNFVQRFFSSKILLVGTIVSLVIIGFLILIFLRSSDSDPKTSKTATQEASSSTQKSETLDKNQTEPSNSSEQTNSQTQVPPPQPATVQPPPPVIQPPPPPPPAVVNKTVTITINGSGNYSQTNLTINAGDTINWVNNDNSSHSPASNPHPQHTNYAGFDADNIDPGASYSFTFNNKGSWGWHDHRFTSVGGIISVQ